LALKVQLAGSAFKYLEGLDRITKARIREKLEAIAEAPYDPRLSKPLTATAKRSTRIGSYRVLFEIDEETLFVADIGPRGQIHRRT
jgi:mRNA-degrading endonuclease RelE of RelBE toxin-antitoxin system